MEEVSNALLDVEYVGEFSEWERRDVYDMYHHRELENFSNEWPLRSRLFKDLKKNIGEYNDAKQYKIIEYIKYINIHHDISDNIIAISFKERIRGESAIYVNLYKHKKNFKAVIKEIKNQNKIKKNMIDNNENIEYLTEDILKKNDIVNGRLVNTVFFNTQAGLIIQTLFETWGIYW